MSTRLFLSTVYQPFRHSISHHRIVPNRLVGTGTGWVTSFAEGLQLAKQNQKPIMLIIHRHWCKACQNLMPLIKKDAEIISIGKQFVTIEMTGSEEDEEEKYAPDGAYVPRIVFLTSNGEIIRDARNESNLTGTNMYYYQDTGDLINSMKKALK